MLNDISFSPLDQQLLRFSPLLDHVTEMTCHLFKLVQFDFEEGSLINGLGIKVPMKRNFGLSFYCLT